MLDKREEDIRKAWLELMAKIHDANTDLIERAEQYGLTAEFIEAEDTLRITLDVPPATSYAQRVGLVTITLDDDTDQIVGFTVASVTQYATQHPEQFDVMLPALRRFGTIHLPARSVGAERMAQSLRELVPA
jgi:hypothetical protein